MGSALGAPNKTRVTPRTIARSRRKRYDSRVRTFARPLPIPLGVALIGIGLAMVGGAFVGSRSNVLAATMGNAEAWHRLGTASETSDPARAAVYFERALRRGYRPALWSLARVTCGSELALWRRQAASLGDVGALEGEAADPRLIAALLNTPSSLPESAIERLEIRRETASIHDLRSQFCEDFPSDVYCRFSTTDWAASTRTLWAKSCETSESLR